MMRANRAENRVDVMSEHRKCFVDVMSEHWKNFGDISVLLNRAISMILKKMSSEMLYCFKDNNRKDVELGHQARL